MVSVIVLNWNGKPLLDDCFESILNQTYSKIEIIFVDNGSSDGSVDFVKKKYPQIKIIANKKNEGFAKAINQGMKMAAGNYVMPLNNDVILKPDFIEKMVEAIEADAKTGIVSGKLLRAEKEGKNNIIDSVGHVIFKNRLPRNKGVGLVDNGLFLKKEPVFGACGAAPLYRKEMLDDIAVNGEYYDESFFSFLEDVDLDWRARLRGWECVYTPQAVALHFRGGTAVRRSKIVEMHNYKNWYLIMLKNDNIWPIIKNLHHIVFTDIIKSTALLIRAPSALLGLFEVVKLFPSTLRKRKVIQSRRTVSSKEMEKWFESFNYRSWFKQHLSEDVYNLRK